MELVQGWQEVPPHLKGASLAIGTFDGVHRGHRALIAQAKAQAQARGAPLAVRIPSDAAPQPWHAKLAVDGTVRAYGVGG